MTLYIHFGIYKAGSSYIQYICANRREYLRQNDIYFPESVEDKKMKSGLISKGNADGLNAALIKDNAKTANAILKKWLQEAKNRECKAVLISAEALVHQLGIQNSLELIEFNARAVGFNEINAMGFFRDLADHALSTYKHRAKSGKWPDYEYWVSEVYETPRLLHQLADTIIQNQNVKWTLRKFQKNSDFLKKAFFKDWLGINPPIFEEKRMVNESASISEVLVLTHLKRAFPSVIGYFIDDLKALPKAQKAKDKDLEAIVYNTFVRSLNNSLKCLDKINSYFRDDEKLILGNLINHNHDIYKSIVLSESQLETIVKRIRFFETFKGKLILIRRGFARLLPT